jgi:nucleoside-diphosphate-sugar epimerase
MCGLRADSRQAERLGDGGDDGDGAVGRNRKHTLHVVPAGDVGHPAYVAEIEHLARVRIAQAGRRRIAVHRDNSQPSLPRLRDRTLLVAACPHEENRAHRAAMLLGLDRSVDELEQSLQLSLRQKLDRITGRGTRLASVSVTGKRILLTGGAGFIGTTLARRLIGENEIVVLDNLHRDRLSDSDLAEHSNLSFHQGDVLDAELVRELARGATHIVHLAAIAGVDTVLESPVRTMRVNLIGTYNVLEAAAASRDSVERLVDFSTSEVFGTHAYKVEETHMTSQGSVGEARWTYAVSKLAGEYMAHSYYDEFGLPTCSVRPFNVYGPGQIGGGAIRAFIETILAGEDLVIHGDGSQIRAWCYVDDMVDALLLVLEREEALGQVFNIGNARSVVTIYDLATRIRRLMSSHCRIHFRPLHYTDVEMRIPNVDKARNLLGWEAKVDLDEGLARTIAWYRERTPSLT